MTVYALLSAAPAKGLLWSGIAFLVCIVSVLSCVLPYLWWRENRRVKQLMAELTEKEELLLNKTQELCSRPKIIKNFYHLATIGNTSCGKTALTLKWTNPLIDIVRIPSTVNPVRYDKRVSIQESTEGFCTFHVYSIFDYGGEDMQEVRDAMQTKDIRALLLVVDVAKTMTDPNDQTKRTSVYSQGNIDEQVKLWNYDALKFLFSKEIQKSCSKYILFINKLDVLQSQFPESDEQLDARARTLYKDVIDSLARLSKKFGAKFTVLTGSAQTGRGCPELYKELLVDILPLAARDESLQYVPDAKHESVQSGSRTVELNLS